MQNFPERPEELGDNIQDASPQSDIASWNEAELHTASPLNADDPAVAVNRQYPFWTWIDAFLFVGALIVLLVVTVMISSIFHLMGLIGMAPAAIVAQGIAMGIALLGLSRLFRLRYGVRLREALHLRPPEKILQYAGLGLATALMVAILGAVLKLSEMDMPMKELIRTDFDLLMVGIGAVTFGPLFEELVFRGFLQPLFGKLVGAVPGIFATSLLFAIPHGPQYGWHWQHLLVITAAGSVFGLVRWKTASTTASTIAHAAYNSLLVAVAFLQRADVIGG
jgi:uncharacterized protein